MALTLSKESLKETLNADNAGAALTRLQNMQVFRQMGTLLLIAGAVAAGLMVFFWSQKPDYSPLYTGLDAKATAEAADLLRGAQIPFKLDQASGAISVPEKHLHDARLKLASSGLAESGRLGFEMMERDPGFGVSQFVENARYQHALETELVRTISTLRPVRDARVHLAIPKPSAFTRQREVSSASVVLDLRSGAMLERNQVDAIVHLVASSIPDLAPERVTVVDQSGRMLTITDPNSEAALNAAQFERVRKLETSFNQRIRELLEPLAGPGRINAEVAVDMDFSVIEEARETFANDPAKIRSEQVSQNTVTKPGPEGVPGATSNTPPGPGAAADANPNAPTETASSATRNFEMDRTLQHTRQPAGRIRRVTAAVLVDHVPRTGEGGKVTMAPLDAATLARVEALVKEAVGFDAARGDSVSVMNAPFVREADPAAAETPFWENPVLQNPLLRDIARFALGAVVVLALLFGVLRPAIRQIANPSKKLPAPAIDVSLVDEADEDQQIVAALQDGRVDLAPRALASDAYEDRLRQAREAVRNDSKQVAQVVKDWVSADE
ncbi:flagellar basal-body MS-ring/collar protein FliF [Pseudoxanthomonas wuyuanensis]|uniref:Flagellar M-ring protein n=1 Tax=Pseudoxanthomonas wuyuanensis TaxID=1073196 RepID=A0A286D018_9GAMM|nr:flagellar basal-body MS-ring/collar protein FliF [Pseudoxanthomonas wuyuanensis]KAF1722428.1 flagellar M-ring protein FliF [Pseudoxanthomonas wuyuanensis]SOD51969.1 flagellar M-ring protein FliF [Pseudoxanthomonas wuyuanensis]